jgi:hypothetical protein
VSNNWGALLPTFLNEEIMKIERLKRQQQRQKSWRKLSKDFEVVFPVIFGIIILTFVALVALEVNL